MTTSTDGDRRSGLVMTVDGEACDFSPGDTIASAMMRSGREVFRRSRSGEARGVYCAIGICNECLVSVGGTINVRACITPAESDLQIQTSARER
jgi:predicted molibdopterin-dependent oxidoreductase YjgC